MRTDCTIGRQAFRSLTYGAIAWTVDFEPDPILRMIHPPIEGGVSLLIALSLASKTTLVVGGGSLAATRATAALQADSLVLILVENDAEVTSEEIIARRDRKELDIVHFKDAEGFEQILQTLSRPVATAFITDTFIGTPHRRTYLSAATLRQSLSRRNILVNVADMPTLCDFTLPTCHRFPLSQSTSSTRVGSLQVAVTTNGKGCRLASRIRREVVSRLPFNIGDAVENVAKLRARVKSLDEADKAEELDGSEDSQPTTPNDPVGQGVKAGETIQERQLRRMRWVAQVSEYWPLERLATMEPEKMDELFKDESTWDNNNSNLPHHQPMITPSSQRGKIYLLGSGTGHPGLLTVAAHDILTRKATLVLSDKLVPAEVLALIPSSTTVKIAKKFPGNADGAQNELMVEAVEAARRGEAVVRVRLRHLRLILRSDSGLAQTRRSNGVRAGWRRDSLLSKTWLRVDPCAGYHICNRWTGACEHSCHAAWCRRVDDLVYRCWTTGQTDGAPGLHSQSNLGPPDGCCEVG